MMKFFLMNCSVQHNQIISTMSSYDVRCLILFHSANKPQKIRFLTLTFYETVFKIVLMKRTTNVFQWKIAQET